MRKRLYVLLPVTLVLVNLLVFASIAVFTPDTLTADDAERRCLEMEVIDDKETCVQWELNKTYRSTIINPARN